MSFSVYFVYRNYDKYKWYIQIMLVVVTYVIFMCVLPCVSGVIIADIYTRKLGNKEEETEDNE
jgi:hypothetical protein